MKFLRGLVFFLATVSLSAALLVAQDNITYRTRDGRSWIRLVSSNEVELRRQGTTLLGKYTIQNGSLRVILTVMGTQEVLYFKRTQNGYTSEDGVAYLTPAAIAELQAQEQAAREERQRAQQAEAVRRAEAEHVAREAAQREAERAREAAAKKLKAEIDMLEGTDCSTEALSISVPGKEVRDFVLSPGRACWTPWLIGTPYLNWELGGDVVVQVLFQDGTTKEQLDGPGKKFDLEFKLVDRIRFKSLQKQPAKVLFKAHY